MLKRYSLVVDLFKYLFLKKKKKQCLSYFIYEFLKMNFSGLFELIALYVILLCLGLWI